MDAITENNLKIVMLLMNGHEHLKYSYNGYCFNIHDEKNNREYAIILRTLQKIAIMEDTRIEFIMSTGGYLYINLNKNYVSVGLA